MIRLNIINDGTGTPEIGNYEVECIMPEREVVYGWIKVEARVEDFPRKNGYVALLHAAAAALEAAPERPA